MSLFFVGWTSFTVCGKLRRLVKVQKVSIACVCMIPVIVDIKLILMFWLQVGHAGTLDPMATGLLIVGVGKATKIMDRYIPSL